MQDLDQELRYSKKQIINGKKNPKIFLIAFNLFTKKTLYLTLKKFLHFFISTSFTYITCLTHKLKSFSSKKSYLYTFSKFFSFVYITDYM